MVYQRYTIAIFDHDILYIIAILFCNISYGKAVWLSVLSARVENLNWLMADFPFLWPSNQSKPVDSNCTNLVFLNISKIHYAV